MRAPGNEQLRVARDLGPGHREAHVGEEAASAALADVPLGLRRRAPQAPRRRVDAELFGQPLELFSAGPGGGDARIVPVPRRRPVAIPPQDAVFEPPRMHVLFDLMAAYNVSDPYVEGFLGDPKLADSYGLLSLIGAARSITPTDVAAPSTPR